MKLQELDVHVNISVAVDLARHFHPSGLDREFRRTKHEMLHHLQAHMGVTGRHRGALAKHRDEARE
jgi:hypothetical protein